MLLTLPAGGVDLVVVREWPTRARIVGAAAGGGGEWKLGYPLLPEEAVLLLGGMT